ncbi:MAG: PD-(D/E)XK nuclease family protein [Synechococcales cyanobacterium CRU_2_2]|nr:PD-(D/E)XK nuclease family protein [Synechococcales cyanobacterium CRU_2_2]
MLRLSQGQLSLLDTCPRKFQYMVLEQCALLPSPEQQAGLIWGDRFHLLMQQQQLGLPVETLLAGDPAFRESVQAIGAIAPDLFSTQTPEPKPQRFSEHLRSFALGGHSFSVVYDLLLTEPDRAQIIDWKTYPRPQNDRWLAEHWQTRLYCYALAETSEYRPEQISMTYWFVQEKAQSLHIPYGPTQHQQIHNTLLQTLDRLDRWRTHYQNGQPLPQVEVARGCAIAVLLPNAAGAVQMPLQ